MDKKQYRRYLLAAILLVGLLPVLGYYGARLLPGPVASSPLESFSFQIWNTRHLTPSVVVRQGSLFVAGAAGYLCCFAAAARFPWRKSWPFLLLIPAGRLLRYCLPLLWTEIFERPEFVPFGQMMAGDLQMYWQPVPAGAISFAGITIAYFLGAGVYRKRMSENGTILLTAGTALAATLLLGFGIKGINTLCFADNTIWVGDYRQMLIAVPFQLTAAAAAMLAGKELLRQLRQKRMDTEET